MTEDKKASSSDDSCERLAIPPDMHEVMLRNINKQGLKELGDMIGIANLSPAEFASEAFPVEGRVYGENNRLMVCLPCRRVKKSAATVNVWFIVNTGSNCTFLAKETVEALIRDDDPFPGALLVAIQDPDSEIECHVSPPEPKGHFEDANFSACRLCAFWSCRSTLIGTRTTSGSSRNKLFSFVHCLPKFTA